MLVFSLGHPLSPRGGFWHTVRKCISFLTQCFSATVLIYLTFCSPYLNDNSNFPSTPRGLRKGHNIKRGHWSVSNTLRMSSYYQNIFGLQPRKCQWAKSACHSPDRKQRKIKVYSGNLNMEILRYWTTICTGSSLVWHTWCSLLPVPLLRRNMLA